jgi:hypothetical protein
MDLSITVCALEFLINKPNNARSEEMKQNDLFLVGSSQHLNCIVSVHAIKSYGIATNNLHRKL